MAGSAVNRATRVTTGQLRTINLAAALADTNPNTAFNPFCDGFAFSCNTPATLARLNGFSIIAARLVLEDYVAKAAGHASPQVTLSMYSHALAGSARYRRPSRGSGAPLRRGW